MDSNRRGPDLTRPNDPHAATSDPIVLEMGDKPAAREWTVRYLIDRDLIDRDSEEFLAVGDPELFEPGEPEAYWSWTDGAGNTVFMLPAHRLIYAVSEPAHESVKVEHPYDIPPGAAQESDRNGA